MSDLKQISCCKMGAFCALFAGCCYFVVAILAYMLPESIASYRASDYFFSDFMLFKELFFNFKLFMMLANISMIGVVCSFLMLCRDKFYGVVLLSSILAIIGYAVGIYQQLIDISVIPRLAEKFMMEPTLIQDVIITFGVSNPMMFILTLGLPGVWFLIVSILGYSNHSIPKILIFFGVCLGVGNILTALAHAFSWTSLLYVVAVGAIVCAPAWGVFEGFYLLSLSHKMTEK